MENYQPKDIEQKWYQYWETNNLFSPDISDAKETYSIVIPPPNVTGSLHVGHALVNSLQDVLIRWKRMNGYKTLWLPGTDHAGIATQMVVQRELLKKGIEKDDLGRDKFIEEVWKWKEESGNMIFKQLRRLGASLDWSRERFTLDDGLSKAVSKTFVELYEEGLIYRGNYIVNWCPHDKTALSDLEVDSIEKEGSFTHIKYMLEDGSGSIIVATTRPETMLGDTAVAVSPDDERYKDLIGKNLILPLTKRLIPIIADDYVDPEFGTGAVKITPAHDPNDFHMGKRHNLPSINIFTDTAHINGIYPPLEGLDRFEARKKIVELLKEEGLFIKQDKHVHAVGHCQRCQTIVEPRESTQWFCKMSDMAKAAMEAMNTGEIKFVPESQGKVFAEWMNNIQDWCLSRQIWWGHRIPAFHCTDCGELIVTEEQSVSECPACKSKNITAETDVLDTWFSSGLFPFSTMGWPEETQDLSDFYPNSTLITGYDILFFWVARMIMLGMKKTGQVPFPEVFLHGLVRDEQGNKMSKTRGNVIDPLDVIEEYGADALRFTLTSLTVMGRDIKLNPKVIEGNRNFINKIWNAVKFTLHHHERLGTAKAITGVKPGIFDQWILDKLDLAAYDVDRYLGSYRFNEAAKKIYSFIWNEICDWYIELSKPALFEKLGKEAQEASYATLFHVVTEAIKLLHPMMPFVTEEMYHNLPHTEGSIMLASFPSFGPQRATQHVEVDDILELISQVRNIRGENNIKPNLKLNITLVTESPSLTANVKTYQEIIQSLAGVDQINPVASFTKVDGWAGSVGSNFEVYIDLSETIDVAAETNRLQKEMGKLEKKAAQIEGKLGNQGFLAKAPAKVVEKNKEELAEIKMKMNTISENLAGLKKLS